MVELTRDIVDSEHYVARYAMGRLNDAEREAFEEFCLLHPDVIRDVEADRVLIAGLRDAEARPLRPSMKPLHRFALAAGIAILAIGAWMFSTLGRHAELQVFAGSGHASAARLRVMTLREPAVHRLNLDEKQHSVELRVYPNAMIASSEYAVTITGLLDGRTIRARSLTGLLPDETDDAALTFVVGIPDRKDAQLRISIVGQHGNAGEFELRVTHRR